MYILKDKIKETENKRKSICYSKCHRIPDDGKIEALKEALEFCY